jgi:hypothetical protein
MEGILFLVVMIAVGWIVIWSFVDRSKSGGIWWPFDYISREKPIEIQEARRTSAQTAFERPRPWRSPRPSIRRRGLRG